MSIEMNKPTPDPELLRKEWQEKYDPNLEDLKGMRDFIEKRMCGDPGNDQKYQEPVDKFNNFK